MSWLLYIVLGVLGLNLLVILLVGFVLVTDWFRNRTRGPRAVADAGAGGPRGEGRTGP